MLAHYSSQLNRNLLNGKPKAAKTSSARSTEKQLANMPKGSFHLTNNGLSL